MNPDILSDEYMPFNPSTPSASSNKNRSSVGGPSTGNYSDDSPPHPTVKQTWEEFCREQESIRLQQSPGLSEAYWNGPQINQARTHSAHNRWQPRIYNKRTNNDGQEQEPQLKSSRKRKKPLSQNVPAKKEWAIEDAERALAVEVECNKRTKSALIIKFPDLELNRDIVAGFHSDIENVHFQQPCTPRFCFITLKDSANVEDVKTALNKQKFGDNYLSVEYKKDREDEQTVNAKDLDPYTLYVGNLAQEITKEDMIQLYPNCRRIDIGYAKKMKFTRYAFVVFHTIDTAIESFKRTHNQQIYSKSLIVRFRRLHGTVGMPGDNKQQNPSKPQPETPEKIPNAPSTSDEVEVTYESERTIPYTMNVKKEVDNDNNDEDELLYEEEDFNPETNLTKHPKPIKFEVKSEIKPEVYEYPPDSKVGIKAELKQERHKYNEPEFNDYTDAEFEADLDAFANGDEFEHMFKTYAEHRKQMSSLQSATF